MAAPTVAEPETANIACTSPDVFFSCLPEDTHVLGRLDVWNGPSCARTHARVVRKPHDFAEQAAGPLLSACIRQRANRHYNKRSSGYLEQYRKSIASSL